MKNWIILLLTAFSPISMAGNESHGGDTVLCAKSSENQFEGYWNLDYLLTYTAQNANADVSPVLSWAESQNRILTLLKTKAPSLAASFESFSDDVLNTFDYAKPHVWEEGSFGLVLVKKDDEVYQLMDRKLPKNCYSTTGDQEINLIRTVTWSKKGNTVFYLYDSKMLSSLPALQASFLYIHEWLREFTQDETVIRRVNRLLHSKVVEAPHYNLKNALAVIGFSGTAPLRAGFVPYCDRTPLIRDVIELRFGKPCGQIKAGEAPPKESGAWDLNLKHSGLSELRPGDFGGSLNLRKIILNENFMTELPKGIFFFLDLEKNTKHETLLDDSEISLEKNELTHIQENSFSGVSVDYLNLKGNKIRSVADYAFSDLRVNAIQLHGNQIEQITPRTFALVQMKNFRYQHTNGHCAIYLSENKIQSIPVGLFKQVKTDRCALDLTLNKNQISKIEDGAFSLESFESLNLSDNQIILNPKMFDALFVERLDLSRNKIETIPDGTFAYVHFENGKMSYDKSSLDLSENKIQSLSPKSFEYVENLHELNLDKNQLKEIPAALIQLVKIGKIETLSLKENPFSKEYKNYLKQQLGNRVSL